MQVEITHYIVSPLRAYTQIQKETSKNERVNIYILLGNNLFVNDKIIKVDFSFTCSEDYTEF